MKVTVEDKIELFRNLIFREIEEFVSERKDTTVKSFEQEKRRLLQELEAKKIHILEDAEKKAEKEKQQLIAKTKSQGLHKLLDIRQQFINEIAELLVREAKNFVLEEGYKSYLLKNLKKAAAVFEGSGSVKLFFTKRDLETLGEFISQRIAVEGLNGKCLLQEASRDIIGGFYAEDRKQGIQADYTLGSLIEENRQLIGSNISRRLDEVQDNGK